MSTRRTDSIATWRLFNSGMEFFIAMFNLVVLALGGYLIYQKQPRPDSARHVFALHRGVHSATQAACVVCGSVHPRHGGLHALLRDHGHRAGDQGSPERQRRSKNVRGDICFHDVTFAYESGRCVLSHVDLDIPAGRTLALVGPERRRQDDAVSPDSALLRATQRQHHHRRRGHAGRDHALAEAETLASCSRMCSSLPAA